MRWFWILAVCAILCASEAWAHRVNIFAYVEGADVVVECGYSRSKRVRHGLVEVYAAPGGKLLWQGTTDEQGYLRFPVPEEALAAGTGLHLVLKAGEGHQAEWTIKAEEFASVHKSKTPAVAQPADTVRSAPVAAQPAASASPGSQALTRADLEEVLGTVLDAKLAPLKRAVLEEKDPGLREIIGGIGWIFGIVGVAAYFMSRRRV